MKRYEKMSKEEIIEAALNATQTGCNVCPAQSFCNIHKTCADALEDFFNEEVENKVLGCEDCYFYQNADNRNFDKIVEICESCTCKAGEVKNEHTD